MQSKLTYAPELQSYKNEIYHEIDPEDTSVLLENAIKFISTTHKEKAEELIHVLINEVLKGTFQWDKNIIRSIHLVIEKIDVMISKQLNEIMHHDQFKKLEGSWRGLHYLVMNSETNNSLKIKVMNCTKLELTKDINKAVEFDQSQFFKKLYENEFGSPGGEPFGVLIGDYEFSHHPEDVHLLQQIAHCSAAAFCPFISAASPELFGFSNWSMLSKPRDLEKVFDSIEYIKWRNLRESDDSRFVNLLMPRVLARLPYGKNTCAVEAFNFEETYLDPNSNSADSSSNHYCWTNAAYILGGILTQAFSQYGWCTAVRGAESGGRVNHLPLHIFKSDEGDFNQTCPTEIGITDRREAELSKLGFLPICHYKNTDFAVFFGAQSIHKPKIFDRPEATANAAISARLPYIMATSRFAHYLKVMARDKIGSFMEVHDLENWLNRWILNYVNGNVDAGQVMKSKYPLAEAKVYVEPIPGKPGCYQAVTWLRPWLQLEELTTSMRLVAQVPKISS